MERALSRRRAMRNRVQELTMAALVRYDAGLDDALYASAEGGAEEGRPDIAKRKLEKVLVVGNWLFQAICLTEKNWRTEVTSGETPYIPYAAMSETSSNCWKFSVINEASCWEYVVDKPSRTSWMAA
jgi:hypothetical protein